MHSIRRPVNVLKSGLVVSLDAPYLRVSPDGKVIDSGCSTSFDLSEVKCPKQNFWSNPWMLVLIATFFLENQNGELKLKQNHKYYTQVQGLMGVTGARWCDFEGIPFDDEY